MNYLIWLEDRRRKSEVVLLQSKKFADSALGIQMYYSAYLSLVKAGLQITIETNVAIPILPQRLAP